MDEPDNLHITTTRVHSSQISFERQGKDFIMWADQWLFADREKIWAFVSDCRHINFVIPSIMRFTVLGLEPGQAPSDIAPGVIYNYKLHLHGIGFFWRTLISEVQEPHQFKDEQAKGPYAYFSHEHLFETCDGGTQTTDIIRYRPPGGPLAGIANALVVRRDLRKIFRYRHQRMTELFADGGDPATRYFASASCPSV